MVKIVKAIKDWAYLPISQILIMMIFLMIAWFVHNHAPSDLTSLNNFALAVSTLLFGFLTLSLTMHLQELRGQKKDVSDLGKELLIIRQKVKEDPSLKKREVHSNTQYWHYGFKGFASSGNAEEIIGEAYNYLMRNMRDVVHASRLWIFAWSLPAIFILLASIAISFLSQFMSISNEIIGVMDLTAVLFGGVMIILGWWDSNKKIDEICDSIFNIRHTILSDLYGGDSHLGYSQ